MNNRDFYGRPDADCVGATARRGYRLLLSELGDPGHVGGHWADHDVLEVLLEFRESAGERRLEVTIIHLDLAATSIRLGH